MRNILNTIFLLLVTAAIAGFGHWKINTDQPAKVQKINDTIQLAELQQAEVDQLLVQLASSEELAGQSLAKWRSRYKSIPPQLSTAEMVLYLESLTRSGFEQFDIDLQGVTDMGDYSFYTFRVNATAYFKDLYHFVWHIENNREFYRINDLKMAHKTIYKENTRTGIPRRLDMVDLSFTLDAYFSGSEGLTVEDDELIPIPRQLLAMHAPAHNSFYPIIRTDLPPNDELLLDVEEAELVSITGVTAVFEGNGETFYVKEGDRIYLGEVTKVDPHNLFVRVKLNKGGKVLSFDIKMDMETDFQQYRQQGAEVYPIEN